MAKSQRHTEILVINRVFAMNNHCTQKYNYLLLHQMPIVAKWFRLLAVFETYSMFISKPTAVAQKTYARY